MRRETLKEKAAAMPQALSAHAGEEIGVALLGCGTVGSEVVRIMRDYQEILTPRIGRPLALRGVAVRDTSQPRAGIDSSLLTGDPQGLVEREDVDIVVEVMGGIEPARSLLMTAISRGASVVTANKALLATYGADIFQSAYDAGVDVYFEAAVAGAIPVVRPLRESLVGDSIQRVMGIVNGTTNFILDRMTTQGMDFSQALAQAQALGYAEADPTADVAGLDAAS